MIGLVLQFVILSTLHAPAWGPTSCTLQTRAVCHGLSHRQKPATRRGALARHPALRYEFLLHTVTIRNAFEQPKPILLYLALFLINVLVVVHGGCAESKRCENHTHLALTLTVPPQLLLAL